MEKAFHPILPIELEGGFMMTEEEVHPPLH